MARNIIGTISARNGEIFFIYGEENTRSQVAKIVADFVLDCEKTEAAKATCHDKETTDERTANKPP